ncbi:MAG: EamA family transporter [Methylophilaceae bacterium]
MSNLAIFVWLLNIVVDTTGHVAFKHAAVTEHASELQRWKRMLVAWPLWVGIFCFCLEFVLWLILLSILPLSLGVLLSGFNTVAIMLAGRFIFKEMLDPFRVLGITLITVGVVMVGGYL